MATVKYIQRSLDNKILLKHESDIIPRDRTLVEIKRKKYFVGEIEYHPMKKGMVVNVYLVK